MGLFSPDPFLDFDGKWLGFLIILVQFVWGFSGFFFLTFYFIILFYSDSFFFFAGAGAVPRWGGFVLGFRFSIFRIFFSFYFFGFSILGVQVSKRFRGVCPFLINSIQHSIIFSHRLTFLDYL